MKLPKGYGSVCKLSGRRRRPYIVRKDGNIIGYAHTRAEGIEMLVDYNRDPFDERENLTFKEVFDLLIKYKQNELNEKTLKNYQSHFRRNCKDLYDKKYIDLRLDNFLDVMNSAPISDGAKNNLRKFLRAMDRFAYQMDIIQKEYTRYLPTIEIHYSERNPFSEEEIQKLWDNLDIEDVDLVLILIYTGFRSGEFSDIKIENIHLDEGYIVGGNKTKAGKNRRVPIHRRIKQLIKNRMDESKGKTLLNYGDKQLRVRFKRVMEKLGMTHIPHECRHTMRTRLDNMQVRNVTIDLILGHQSQNVGERIYTHKTLDQLKDAVNLLP